jgi:hypothetical protein
VASKRIKRLQGDIKEHPNQQRGEGREASDGESKK